ncbi:hypothetical protein L6164_014721 [Bauhinia variegata]|uniref:Uncharacterized protein n=1 Tax=Bauhinia variegata TaxID=167791 RepID=A0ACB9NIZ7_BAUVA|nr:hypothetical protein L6164_014721 [Bauhinia variegata]
MHTYSYFNCDYIPSENADVTRDANLVVEHDSNKPPVATTVFFGANDAALLGRTSERQHVPVEEYKANLRKIVHHLKECSPTLLIVLITPPPVSEEGRKAHAESLYGEKAMKLPERTNEVTVQYAKACVDVAEETDVCFINVWSKMQETEGWQKKFLSDGLHLTPEGNAVVCLPRSDKANRAMFNGLSAWAR